MATLNSTLYTKQTGGQSPVLSHGLSGNLKAVQAVIAVPATGAGTALNDTLGLFVLPKGATPHLFSLDADQLDSNGSPTLTIDVGVTGSAQSIVAAWAGASGAVTGAVSPNRVTAKTAWIGLQLTADTPIFATVHAAAATKAAGNLIATCYYTVDGVAS